MSIDNTTAPEFVQWFEANFSDYLGSDAIEWRYARMGWNAALSNSKKPVAWQFKDSEWTEWASITEAQYEAYRTGRHTGSGNSFELRALYTKP